MIYLDNSATTQLDEEVLEAMLPWLREGYGNASSVYLLGRKARVCIESAREEIASLLHAHPAEIVFTSGGTESNNTVLKSCLQESEFVNCIAVSAIEHHAILHPAEYLQKQGYDIRYLPVNNSGFVDTTAIEELPQKNVLISIMHANNEVGTIQPLEVIRNLRPEALFHTDAVQTFGKIPLDVQQIPLDFVSLSAHKIHGPKGIGALFVRRGLDFKAHQQGGAQERNRRGGTEPVALIAGFQVAARRAYQQMQKRAEAMKKASTILRRELEKNPQIYCNTPEENAMPHVINVSFGEGHNYDGEAIIQSMDMYGVAVSNGSACVSGTLQPSHVLMAMGRSKEEAGCAVRFSVSYKTTEEDVCKAAAALNEILQNMAG